MSNARLEIRSPRLFNGRAMLALSFYGLLVSLPALAAMLVVSVRQLSVWTFIVPLLAVATAVFFMPFGFGNPLLGRLVRQLATPATDGAERFVVQLTLTPRLQTGWRAMFEDADDIGWLEVSSSTLSFHGDSVTLAVPWTDLGPLRMQTSGWRGLFACGARIIVPTPTLPKVASLQFAERSSWTIPASRRHARLIYTALARRANPSEPRSGELAQNGPGSAGTCR